MTRPGSTMPTAQQNSESDQAKHATRAELYKQIQRVAAETEDMTAQTAATALKELAEAFAWATATAQPH
ncbi:hypothetical protein [Streptomyces umbrinus]|uniref:hypothetical protein n=1 Tax=Streptomyces umbrinus TaxID=67370 RepID=UPI003C2B1D57